MEMVDTKRVLNQYNAAEVISDNPITTVIMLYDALIRSLYKTKRAIDEGNTEVKHSSIKQAADLVDCLHNGLDLAHEGKLIKALDKYYTNLFIKVNMIIIKDQGHEEVDSILESLRDLRTKWQEFSSRSTPNVDNTHVDAPGEGSRMDVKC